MRQFIARWHFIPKRRLPELSQWLTPAEIRVCEGIRAPQRRRDWLAGRWAAKELIQRYLDEEAGLQLPPSQIEIMNDRNGAPYARLSLELETAHFELSLAHSSGHGLAGVSPHGSLGVDLQRIRPVRSDLTERVLAEYECEQLSLYCNEHESLLTFWVLKEATIKARRIRPAPALREIIVQLSKPGHAAILLRDQKLMARWGRWKEFIWAVVWGLQPASSTIVTPSPP